MLLNEHTTTVKNVQMIGEPFAMSPVSRNETTQYVIHDKIKGILHLGNACITKISYKILPNCN